MQNIHLGGITIKSNKGFTVPEVLIAVLLMGIIAAILTELLVFNATSTTAYSKYGRQQFSIHDAFTRLNRDIEWATDISVEDCIDGYDYKTIKLTIEGETKSWKIDDGKLYMDDEAVVDGLSYESKFTYNSNSKVLTIVLKSESTNEGRFSVNVNKPIVSQYNLIYKK